MRFNNSPQLKEWLKNGYPSLAEKDSFEMNEDIVLTHLDALSHRPQKEQMDAALFRALTHGVPAEEVEGETPDGNEYNFEIKVNADITSLGKWIKAGIIAILVTLWAIFGAIEAHAQGPSTNVAVVVANCGTPPTNIPAASAANPNRVYLTVDSNGQICINGSITGGNAAAVVNGSAAPTTNVDAIGVNVASVIKEVTGTNTSGSIFAIDVNCASGCSGGTTDTDDGTVAGAQVTGLQIGLQYVWDGSNWKRQTIGTAGSGSAQVTTVQGNASGTPIPITGTVTVSGVAGTEYVQDAALTIATTQGGMAMGRASAAVPSDVSADGDAVLPWYLRSGAQAVQLTNAGVLTVSGSGNTVGALRVELANNGGGRMATVDTVTSVTSITNALPAGTNAIGKLAANSGVVIGDVNALCGTGATGLCKAEDAVASSGDTGIAMLGVIQATLTAPAADGDYTVPKLNANGAMWVQSSTIDAAENAAVATSPVPIGGVYRSSPVTLDAGDVGYPLLDVNGRLNVMSDPALRCAVIGTASTNSTGCKGSSGNVYGFRFVNTTATTYYLRMYNLASAPTCSSSTGYVETIPLLPTGGIVSIEPMGESYSTGIGYCVTGGGGSTDNSNGAAGIWGTVLYR